MYVHSILMAKHQHYSKLNSMFTVITVPVFQLRLFQPRLLWLDISLICTIKADIIIIIVIIIIIIIGINTTMS